MATNNYSAQGCIPVRRVRNNDSLSISIESTQPLFQGVDANNDNATPFPNWETDDAAWQNKDKVKNFDGTIDIAWTDDEDDIGDSTSCIFTITAFWGNKVEIAKGTISV